MNRTDKTSEATLSRSYATLFVVAVFLCLIVYLGHGWYNRAFLQGLGIGHDVGVAFGTLIIAFGAFFLQRLASFVVFGDTHFGLVQLARDSKRAMMEMEAEIGLLGRTASTDKLTGVGNRRRLEEAIHGEIDRLNRYDQALSALIIDIDHFKSINDKQGHTVGDKVLVQLSGLMRAALRTSDILTRWGGEEFIVLCPSTTLATAGVLAERLREQTSQFAFDTAGRVTVSIGVAECLIGEDWEKWLDRADAALYRAKHKGRNAIDLAPEVPSRGRRLQVGPSSFLQFSWHKSYELGREEIDREHRALFSIADDLLNAMLNERHSTEITGIIELLLGEVEAHFRHEEDILISINYPLTPRHVEMHRDLLARAKELGCEFALGALDIGTFFRFLAHDMIVKHMLTQDREFYPYLAGNAADKEPSLAPSSAELALMPRALYITSFSSAPIKGGDRDYVC